jgi:hypothetical protein
MAEKRLRAADRGVEPWSRAIVVTLAVNAVLVAVLTWAAVDRASAARDEDRRAVFQTVQSELIRIGAQVQARSENTNAAGYLAAQAQARAVAGLGRSFARGGDATTAKAYAEEADTMAAVAEAGVPLGFDRAYLRDGWFHVDDRQEKLIRANDVSAVSTEAPEDIARSADRLHGDAGWLAVLVVVLVSVILLLTVARVVRGGARRRLLLLAWFALAGVCLAGLLIRG